MKTAWIAAAALAVSLPALADTVYKSTRPDGSVVYGDSPAPGAARVERIELPRPPAPAPATRRQIEREQLAGTQAERRIRERERALDRADAEVKSAILAVEAAQQRLEQSQEPLPGERSANAGGGSRLNDVYQQRVGGLQDELAAARRRLDAAYAQRNAARD